MLGRDCRTTGRGASAARCATGSLGFVYQFHHLLPEFTALENVAMPLLIRRMPTAEARSRRPRPCWSEVGLAHRADPHAGRTVRRRTPARGARARAGDRSRPACSPTSPPATSTAIPPARVFDLMLELNRSHGTSFVIVTHDPAIAARAQRILRLQDGVLIPD